MRISVTSNIDEVLGWLGRLHPQANFAIAKALTDTARTVQREMPAQVERDLDRPTAFTRNAFFSERASKDNLTAVVGAKDTQAEYLRYQVEGGVRVPKRKALRLPSSVELDAYGNLPKGTIARLLAAARSGRKLRGKTAAKFGVAKGATVFYGQPKGHPTWPAGLYSRRDAGGRKVLVPLVVFPKRAAHYKKLFDFYGTAQRIVQRDFEANLARSWANALATAR